MNIQIGRALMGGAVIAVILYQSVVFIRCLQLRPVRRWKLAALSWVGVFHVSFDWASGQLGVDWFSVSLLAGSIEILPGTAIVGVSLPAGALLAQERLTRARPRTAAFRDTSGIVE